MLFIIMAMDISIAVLPSNLRTWTFQEEEERFNLVFKTLNKLLVFVQEKNFCFGLSLILKRVLLRS